MLIIGTVVEENTDFAQLSADVREGAQEGFLASMAPTDPTPDNDWLRVAVFDVPEIK